MQSTGYVQQVLALLGFFPSPSSFPSLLILPNWRRNKRAGQLVGGKEEEKKKRKEISEK